MSILKRDSEHSFGEKKPRNSPRVEAVLGWARNALGILAISATLNGAGSYQVASAANDAHSTSVNSVPATENTEKQKVQTAFGILTFEEIAKHAKREEIISSLGRSDKIDFREWELRVIQTQSESLDRQIKATEKMVTRMASIPGE